MSEPITLHCRDQYPLQGKLFRADSPKGIVIIAAALGIPESYYHRFADFLRSQGFHCLTFNYRGTGKSIVKKPARPVRLEDWGRHDIDTVIHYAVESLAQPSPKKQLPIHLIGHSIGGQLVGMAPSSTQLASIIMIAASAPYWKRWEFPQNLSILTFSRALIPAVSLLRREFPSKQLGLGSLPFPSAVARQWASWMAQPDYLFSAKFKLDTANYAQLQQPVLAYGFADDELAPRINISRLLDFFPKTRKTQKVIDPETLGLGSIGHSGFFKDKFKDSLWQDSLDWLQATSS